MGDAQQRGPQVLLDVDRQRPQGGQVDQARAAGGNRVVAEGGVVDPAAIERELARIPSVDGALRLLRAGARDEVAGQLPALVGALLPLLELLESRLQSGLPLARLREFHDKGGGG